MSNMYPEYKGRTINYVNGFCSHACAYCFVQRMPCIIKRYSGELRLVESVFQKSIGKNRMWFPNSCSDVCAIPKEWFIRILNRLNEFPTNTYLLQSKNPKGFADFESYFPPKAILGTTAETNRDYNLSKAPQPADRLIDFAYLKTKFPKMISIEPILDFDIAEFVGLIKRVKPAYISIGADSKKCNFLSEPSPPEKIGMLIEELSKFTTVRIKNNLKRLL